MAGFNARAWSQKAQAHQQSQQTPPTPIKLASADETEPKNVTWMWYPRIPAGMMTILAAKGGSCKGLTCASVVAAVTTGGNWPDGTGPAPLGNVVWCEAEDPLPEVVIPRLIAAGADRKRVFFANREEFAALDLRQFIEENGIVLIVMSPMVSFLNIGDINSELGVRDVLEQLQASIASTGCALIGIAHTNKKADLAAVERVLGSVAFVNFVRSVLLSNIENRDDNTYRMAHAKYNLSMKGDDLILKPMNVGEDRRSQYVKLMWSESTNGNCDADAMFDRKKKHPDQKPSAAKWLVEYLTEHGESPREVVVSAGEKAGYTEAALEKAVMRSPKLHARREYAPNRSWWSAI